MDELQKFTYGLSVEIELCCVCLNNQRRCLDEEGFRGVLTSTPGDKSINVFGFSIHRKD